MLLFERGRLVDGTHQAKVVVMFYAKMYMQRVPGMLPQISVVFDMDFWLSKGDWMRKGKEKRMEMDERRETGKERGKRGEGWRGEERGMKVVPSVGLR